MKTTKEIKQNHLFWFNQGKLLTKLGKLDAALDCFERAIAIKAIYYEAWCEKGSVLEKLGRFAEAETCFNESLGIFCDDTEHIWEDELDL